MTDDSCSVFKILSKDRRTDCFIWAVNFHINHSNLNLYCLKSLRIITLPTWWLLLLYFWRILHSEYQTLEVKYHSLKMTKKSMFDGTMNMENIAKTSSWQCSGHLDPWIQADLLDFKYSGCWLFAWIYKIDWLLLTLYYWALRRPHQWLQTPPTACREWRDSVYYTKPVGFCSWMSYTTKAHPALQRQSRVLKKRTWGKRRLKKGVTEQNQKGGQDWCYNYAEGRRTTRKRRARPSQPTDGCRKALS